MSPYFRQAVFILFFLSFIPLQSQDYIFPNGTKIALVSDLNRWLSLCEDCQDLKNTTVKLTIISNTPFKNRPEKAAIWTVEHQDGKYRFKSSKNTYMRICQRCRKAKPTGALVVADARLNGQGKVPREALFDIISVENSPYYQIVSYQGKYLSRNHGETGMKKGSQILMAYYGEPCRTNSRFKIIALEEQSHSKVIDHPELKRVGWISAITGDSFNQYMTKNRTSRKVTIPKAGDFVQGVSNSLFGPRFYHDCYFMGHSITGNGTESFITWNDADKSLVLDNLTGLKKQQWNLIKLGTTKNLLGQKKTIFFIKSLLNNKYLTVKGSLLYPVAFQNASIFMYEQNPNKLEGARPDIAKNYEVLKVPGTNLTVINPASLPKTRFNQTKALYLDKEFTFNGDTFRLATLPEIQKIFRAFKNQRCLLKFDGEYYYVNDSGREYYVHPRYMVRILQNELTAPEYEDNYKKRNVFLVKE